MFSYIFMSTIEGYLYLLGDSLLGLPKHTSAWQFLWSRHRPRPSRLLLTGWVNESMAQMTQLRVIVMNEVSIWISINGGTPKWLVYKGNIPLKLIWGYPYFRKRPCGFPMISIRPWFSQLSKWVPHGFWIVFLSERVPTGRSSWFLFMATFMG